MQYSTFPVVQLKELAAFATRGQLAGVCSCKEECRPDMVHLLSCLELLLLEILVCGRQSSMARHDVTDLLERVLLP